METIFYSNPKWICWVIFASATLTSAGSFRFWTKRVKAWGLLDHPGQRKIHTGSIPLSGGLIVGTGMLVPLLTAIVLVELALLDDSLVGYSAKALEQHTTQVGALVCGVLGMLVLGVVDDFRNLSAGSKLGVQFLLASMVAATGTRIIVFTPDPIWSCAITVLWILMLVNAFNIVDGMNGLCTGIASISAASLAFHSMISEHTHVASLGFLVAGALIGFLPFNFPKAKAFLGDSGTHLVGYLIAVLSILTLFHGEGEQSSQFVFIAPVLIAGFALVDMVWVTFYRLRRKKPIYIGDMNHLSHRLVQRGFTECQAVGLLWLFHGLLVAGSFLLLL